MYKRGTVLSKTWPETARQVALQILHTIDTQQAYTDLALRHTLQYSALDRRDRAFVTDCVYGVVRWRERIDWLLQQVCRRPFETLTPWIRNVLRLGTYQCLWMHKVPPWAAVNEAVQLARRFEHQGSAQFVNGVLRTLLRQHATFVLPDAQGHPAAHLGILTSHPQWLVERWLQRYGWERTLALCTANTQIPGITLRTNTLRITPEALAQRLRSEGLRQVESSKVSPGGLVVQGTSRLDRLASYQEGLFQVQDEGAMLVAPLCQTQPGQRVLDVCAAPGGKTTHLAQLMENTGQVLAFDVQPGRLRLLRDNVRRWRLSTVTPIAADATQELPVRGVFERILVDAPCSGLGVLRRHPDIKWRKDSGDLSTLQAVQLTLLRRQSMRLAVGGLLVYSVCSNEPEETHAVVKGFLAEHASMRLEAVEALLPQPVLQASATPGTLDLTPEQWGTDGVFVACFRKCAGQ